MTITKITNFTHSDLLVFLFFVFLPRFLPLLKKDNIYGINLTHAGVVLPSISYQIENVHLWKVVIYMTVFAHVMCEISGLPYFLTYNIIFVKVSPFFFFHSFGGAEKRGGVCLLLSVTKITAHTQYIPT